MKKAIDRTSRRDFARKVTAGIVGAGLSTTTFAQGTAPASAKPEKNMLMHVGADYHVVVTDPSMGWNEKQRHWTTTRNFEYHERCGVRHFTNIMSGAWDLDQMKRW